MNRGGIWRVNPSRSSKAVQNLHEASNQNLGDILPTVLKQVSDEGDVSNPGVVKVGDQGFMMVHKIMRVILKHINVIRG